MNLRKVRKYILLVFVSIILFLVACNKNEENPTSIETNKDDIIVDYLHIAHTRTNDTIGIYEKIRNINFDNYSMLWLGGDLSWNTSNYETNLSDISSVFNLQSENTLLSIGNHDYANLDLLQQYTNKPIFYVRYKNGITFIVLDTQDSLSNIVGEQLQMFNNVIDTISNSSNLILLHHKLFWMYGNSDLESQINSISNGEFGSCFYCVNPNNYYQDIYPRLVEVKNKGIDVYCVAGDIGKKVKQFNYVTDEGITFLASGMWFDDTENYGLVFHHNLSKKVLTWEYISVDDL